jgi:hypothetical protein
MSGPTRRRPGAASPIRLVAEVEEVRTPQAAQQDAARTDPTPPPHAEAAPPPPTGSNIPEGAATPAPQTSPRTTEAKIATTVPIRRSLKARAQTAVLRTGSYNDGYSSFAAFIDGAIEAELARLEAIFNDGEPFPEHNGEFRRGRPLGS